MPRRFHLPLFLLITASPPPLAAQAVRDTAAPIVRGIVITRQNIFADDEATFFLPRLINGLHVTTKHRIVARELLVQVGRPLDQLELAESARNLRRLGVFRLIQIDTIRTDTGLVVHVATGDGWSTKPEFSFRSTGGQAAWRTSLTEENLIGTATRVSLGYASDPDRSAFLASVRQPRLIADRIGLWLALEDRSDGTILSGQVAQSFHTLRDRHAWSTWLDSRDERILRYYEGETQPRDTLQREFGAIGASYGWAFTVGPRVYHRLGVSGRLWRDDYILPGEPPPFARTVYGAIGATWEWRRARYLVIRGLSGAKEQDVDVSTTLRGGLMATPTGFGWDEDGVGVSAGIRYGGVVGRSLFGYVDLNAQGRFTTAGLDSGSVQVSGTAVWSPADHHVVVTHLWSGWLEDPRPGGEFDLGFGIGPRGFRLHAFTGDRAVFGTAEYRFMVGRDWFKVLDLGVATFVDWGGAWYDGSRRRTGWDGGIGLRLGPSRSTDLDLTRVDLVRRGRTDVEPAGWLVVIGRGLTFSLSGIVPR